MTREQIEAYRSSLPWRFTKCWMLISSLTLCGDSLSDLVGESLGQDYDRMYDLHALRHEDDQC
jgi:hypothetical protein